MAQPPRTSPPPASPASDDDFDPFRFSQPVSSGAAYVTRSSPRRRRGPIFADGDPARRKDALPLSDSPPASSASYDDFDPFRFAPPVSPGASDVTSSSPRRRRGPIFADGDPARRKDALPLSDSPPASPASRDDFDPFRFAPPVSPGAAYVTRSSPRLRRGPIFADGDPARRKDALPLSDSPPAIRARHAVSEPQAAGSVPVSSEALVVCKAAASSVAIAESASSSSANGDPPVVTAGTSARGRGRDRARRRGRRRRRPSPVLPKGSLARSMGPADGQTKEEFAFSRLCDLNAEYELLEEGRRNIEAFAGVRYARKDRVEGAWAKFALRVDVCVAVRQEILTHKWVDEVPSEFKRPEK